jgi:pimeloyl-ACP methyl ester carboxylesterase
VLDDVEEHGASSPLPIDPWPGRFVDLPGGPAYVRFVDGSAAARGETSPEAVEALDTEPVLLVHGLGGSATNWTDLMDLLSGAPSPSPGPQSPRLSCAALDLPGFGFSPPGQDGYSIRAHARTVISLIEHLGTAPTHLIGNSMGGAVITKVAAHRPDLVRSLTLVSPALPDLRPRPLPLRLMVVAAPGIGPAMLGRIGRQPAAERTDMSISELYGDPASLHPLRRDQEVAELLRRDSLGYAGTALIGSARSLIAEYFKVGRRSLWRDAEATTAPALILHGSSDRLVNPVMAVKAAKSFRAARVVIYPQVGHVAMMERPGCVAAEVRSFLDSVRLGGDLAAELEGIATSATSAAPGLTCQER